MYRNRITRARSQHTHILCITCRLRHHHHRTCAHLMLLHCKHKHRECSTCNTGERRRAIAVVRTKRAGARAWKSQLVRLCSSRILYSMYTLGACFSRICYCDSRTRLHALVARMCFVYTQSVSRVLYTGPYMRFIIVRARARAHTFICRDAQKQSTYIQIYLCTYIHTYRHTSTTIVYDRNWFAKRGRLRSRTFRSTAHYATSTGSSRSDTTRRWLPKTRALVNNRRECPATHNQFIAAYDLCVRARHKRTLMMSGACARAGIIIIRMDRRRPQSDSTL